MPKLEANRSDTTEPRMASPTRSTKSEEETRLPQSAVTPAEETNRDDRDGEHQVGDKPYSIFTPNEKRIIVLLAGICSFFSPISGQIYFPSLDAISADLHVSSSLVNLTITMYLVRVSCDMLRNFDQPYVLTSS
nr:mfs antiporter qdr2 [Quercus suber]